MQCFACNRDAVQRCPRCGNAYCEGHGADFCAACLDPLNAAPSRSTFRIALLGFLGGCVLALWLLVRPPSVPGEGSPIIRNDGPTASPGITPAGAGGGVSGSVTPVPTAATTPRPSSTGRPGPPPRLRPAPTLRPAAPGPLNTPCKTATPVARRGLGVDTFTLAHPTAPWRTRTTCVGETSSSRSSPIRYALPPPLEDASRIWPPATESAHRSHRAPMWRLQPHPGPDAGAFASPARGLRMWAGTASTSTASPSATSVDRPDREGAARWRGPS
jgi:hypothetical protein